MGSIRLVLRPLSENDLLVEALNVETIGAEFSSALATLAWQVMAVNVARDPSDGEARVRLWLPAEAGVVGRTSLQAAMDAVATSAGLVRARGKMGHCPNCSSGCRAFGSR